MSVSEFPPESAEEALGLIQRFAAVFVFVGAWVGLAQASWLGALTGGVAVMTVGSGLAILSGERGAGVRETEDGIRDIQRAGGLIAVLFSISGLWVGGWDWGWLGAVGGYGVAMILTYAAGVSKWRSQLESGSLNRDHRKTADSAEPSNFSTIKKRIVFARARSPQVASNAVAKPRKVVDESDTTEGNEKELSRKESDGRSVVDSDNAEELCKAFLHQLRQYSLQAHAHTTSSTRSGGLDATIVESLGRYDSQETTSMCRARIVPEESRFQILGSEGEHEDWSLEVRKEWCRLGTRDCSDNRIYTDMAPVGREMADRVAEFIAAGRAETISRG